LGVVDEVGGGGEGSVEGWHLGDIVRECI
jgi:hypothetical protein